MLVHVDTDYGGDPDDACALALLLGWPDVEVVGITTNLDGGGRRAGCVAHHLGLAGRTGVPVAAGAGSPLAGGTFESTFGDPALWPPSLEARPSPPGAALDLLATSIDRGATVVAIGALTNLAVLEAMHPGALDGARIVVMGGWFRPPADGLPPWGHEFDFNLQVDVAATCRVVASGAELTFVTLPATAAVHLRGRDLSRLSASGPLGASLAVQSAAHRDASGFAELARAHTGLQDDLVNFHWDPVTAAVAVGWDGVEVIDVSIEAVVADGVVELVERQGGRPAKAVVGVDAEAFEERFLDAVDRAPR